MTNIAERVAHRLEVGTPRARSVGIPGKLIGALVRILIGSSSGSPRGYRSDGFPHLEVLSAGIARCARSHSIHSGPPPATGAADTEAAIPAGPGSPYLGRN